MKWKRVLIVVIGIIIALLAVCGALMWGVSGQSALVVLSIIFVLVGIALSIGALVWPAKQGQQDGNK